MKVSKIIIENFRRIERQEITGLNDIEIISLIGPNGSGKSTILSAIYFNLFGKNPDIGLLDIPLLTDMEYQVGNQTLRIVRTFSKDRSTSLTIYINNSTKPTPGRKGEKQTLIEKMIGFNESYFSSIVYFEQMEFRKFIKMKPAEKKNELRKWLNLEYWDEVNERIRAQKKIVKKEYESAYLDLGVEERSLQDLKEEKDDLPIPKNLPKMIIESKKEITLMRKKLLSFNKKKEKSERVWEYNELLKRDHRNLYSDISSLESSIDRTQKDISETMESIKEYEDLKCANCGFDAYKDLIKDFKKSVRSYKSEISKDKKLIKSKEEKISLLEKKFKKEIEIGDIPTDLEDIQELELELKDLGNIKSQIESINKKTEKAKKRLSSTKRKYGKIHRTLILLSELIEITSNSGLSNWILSEHLEDLNDHINKILNKMSVKFGIESVELSNSSETVSGEYKEGFDILVHFEDEKVPRLIEKTCGGEITTLAVAIRLGLIELKKSIDSMDTTIIMLDEVFGALDRERRPLVLNILNDLKKEFEQIWVVSHETEIGEVLPNLIEVSRPKKFTQLKALFKGVKINGI